MQPEQNEHKRALLPMPPSSLTTDSDLNPRETKKRRTIEDAIRAAGLDPSQTSIPTSITMSQKPASVPTAATPTMTLGAAKNQAIPHNPALSYAQTLPYQYQRPQQPYQGIGTNGYTNYQFNNYYSQNTYPLIGKSANVTKL